jgi:AraC-like DNA-binding protein
MKIIRYIVPEMTPEVILTHGSDIASDFPVHFHKTFTLGIVEKGERILEIRGDKLLMGTRDIFVIQSLEPHRIYADNDSAHCYKIISFDFPDSLHCFFPELIFKDDVFFTMVVDFHNTVVNAYSVDVCIGQLMKIKKHILQYACQTEKSDPHQVELIKNACQFIELHCDEPVTLSNMAEYACLSQYHFNRLFHKHTGVSPYAYLIHCRIKQSYMRINDETSLTNVAYESGFYDQSHFIKTFKKHTGVLPKKYRTEIKFTDDSDCFLVE